MPDSQTSTRPGLLQRVFRNQSYCWLAAICTVGVMLLVCYCFSLFPFGGSTILRMDLYHQYGPLFAELYDRVTHLRSLLYSWQTGLGAPFLGNYFNYLSSPAAIIILILGHENMPEAIAGMIIAKAALSAFTFTYYLKKSRDRHDFTTAAFGVLYSMCGYFVAYYWNVMWMDAMVYFPLVILGIERIIGQRKPALFIASLALTLLSNYYMGFMTCVFSVFYFIFYFFQKYDFTSLDPDTPKETDLFGNESISLKERFRHSIFLKSGLAFAFGGLAAAGLAAFALLPTITILRNCSATSGTFPSTYSTYFSIFDFLANHLANVNPTIRSSGEDVLPNVYCGIATIMLVPLYLYTKSIPLREKVANVCLLGLLFFSFNINFLNYIWHGFHFPNDLPYRFSFMYSFVLLSIAYQAFSHLREFTGKEILSVGIALIFAIVIIQKIGSKNVEEMTVIISLIFTVTYTLVFFLMRNDKYQKSAVAVLLLCCVIGELSCANTDRYSMDQKKIHYTGDYADFRALKSQLDEYDGGDDYRMDLTYNRARMDPAWYGYNGISTFSSMAYERLSNIQSDLGIYGNYINSYTYYLQTPVYNMMHALKYVVDNDENVTVDEDYYTKLMTVGKFTAYENKYYLPIGMAVGRDVEEWYTDLTNPFLVQADWFEYATGVSDVFGRMDIADIHYYNMNEITSGLDTGDVYFQRNGGTEGELTFILKVQETRHCYLYVNSSAFDSITIGKQDFTYEQHTDEPYIYDLGVITPEEEVSVLITITDVEYGYIDFYPMFVDDEKLNQGYDILKANAMQVTSFEDTSITGTVEAQNDGLFFTSIPYDKGWSVTLDGRKLSKEDIVPLRECYLCFPINKGEHNIELHFRPGGLLEGFGISAFTVLCLIFAAIFFKKRREQLAKEAEFAAESIVLTDDDILSAADAAMREPMAVDLFDGEYHVFEPEANDTAADEASVSEIDAPEDAMPATELDDNGADPAEIDRQEEIE